MVRLSRDAREAQINEQNAIASTFERGTSYESPIFGTVTLGEKTEYTYDGWEHYKVYHSGYEHNWSSASVVTAFTHYEVN